MHSAPGWRARPPFVIRTLLILCAAAALSGCSDSDSQPSRTPTPTHSPTATATPRPTATPSPTPTDFVPALPALHAEPDSADGGRIVDAAGREVLLRGANVNAFVEYWSHNEYPITFPFTAADADLMAAIGWNAVRLLLSWSRLEPAPGEYNEAYLDAIEDAIAVLAARGIYAVIDLHQDAWGPTLAAREDETCAPPATRAFGWDGAPGWATLDGGAARCAVLGIRETSPAVLAAFQAFWDDAPGPGGVGIRTRYVQMLAHVAARFASRASVAGYDPMNEPNAFSPAQQQALSALYGDALAAIRAAEQAAGGPPKLLFFEPSALWSAFGNGAPPDFARDRDVVYAPHIYTGGFDGGPITAAAFQVAYDEARQFGGAPVFSGEWGAGPERAEDPDDGYFLHHQKLQDRFRTSATLWTWRESCGDPHKAGDYRDGRLPTVWGEFEVDCTTNAVLGRRQTLIDQLTRAYVRAAPGRLLETRYDPATGRFTARGAGAMPGVELVAFYPAAQHGRPEVTGSGLDDLRLLAAPGGNVYLVARANAAEWEVNIPHE